ncbi:MAG: TIGR01212 family radical SAM protein [Candidatus Borkfalkiaceae bacterium]|nr:TIGR01212 family radical SAM protein [Christensenellaceae bacterium]
MEKRYYSANEFFKWKFGEKVYKLALAGGYTCPNRDGKAGTGGCIFCSGEGSGDFAEKRIGGDFNAQLIAAQNRLKNKNAGNKFIAYFQSFTATYASADYITNLITPALKSGAICSLSIATRPDCLGDYVIKILKKAAQIKPLFVELGLQTSNEKTAEKINRCYKNEIYESAVKKLKDIGVNVITHIILGLPFETEEDMLASVDYACRYTDGIKLQLLHVLKGTPLEKSYLNGEFETLSLERYADILCKAVRRIPKNIVIHRLTGDAPKKDLSAPLWSADKKRVLNYINAEFEKRNVMQGELAPQ